MKGRNGIRSGLSAVALSLLIPTDLASNFDAEVVEAHCYFVDIGRTDREQKRSRIDNNDCRAFRPSRPLSLRTKLFCAQLTKAVIVIDSTTYLLTVSSPDKTLMLSASICVKCPFLASDHHHVHTHTVQVAACADNHRCPSVGRS